MHNRYKFIEIDEAQIKRFRGRRKNKDGEPRTWVHHATGEVSTYGGDPRRKDKKPHYKAPRWFRNCFEGAFRAEVRALIRKERFDELPPRRLKNADWEWD